MNLKNVPGKDIQIPNLLPAESLPDQFHLQKHIPVIPARLLLFPVLNDSIFKK